jgi:hypothetical protein
VPPVSIGISDYPLSLYHPNAFSGWLAIALLSTPPTTRRLDLATQVIMHFGTKYIALVSLLCLLVKLGCIALLLTGSTAPRHCKGALFPFP